MISLEEARSRVTVALARLDAETIGFRDAAGRTLAAPFIAERTQPPFAASAMDGYAVRSADLGAGDTTLTLIGESAAGHAYSGTVAAGQAARISTGAVIPDGADQVVIQENTHRDGDRVLVRDTARPNANIRRAGIDFETDQTLALAGTRIQPEHIGLAASAGVAQFSVTRRPRVGLISTGDELVEADETLAAGQIVNSNAPALSAHIAAWGGEARYLGIARDDPADVREKLGAVRDLDLLVTIGGASVGDHDHLRTVYEEMGGQLDFEKIALKPGKPTWFGALDGVPCLGLPGNPVSALVVSRLLLEPAIRILLGEPVTLNFERAPLSEALPANGPRETFVRGARDPQSGAVAPLVNQDSSALSALAEADLLIRRPAHAGTLAPGETAEILPLSRV